MYRPSPSSLGRLSFGLSPGSGSYGHALEAHGLAPGGFSRAALGCVSRQPEKPGEAVGFEKVPAGELPRFSDDIDSASLKEAIQRSLLFYGKIPEDRVFKLGDREVRVRLLKETLHCFLELLNSGEVNAGTIDRFFDVYRVRYKGRQGHSLVTGYYEPILEGRLTPDDRFCHPLYGLPSDLVTVDLSSFDPTRFPGERLMGRLAGNRVVPYYSRREIEGLRVLESSGGQLVWLQDPIDVFFLHVQGSGMIRLP